MRVYRKERTYLTNLPSFLFLVYLHLLHSVNLQTVVLNSVLDKLAKEFTLSSIQEHHPSNK